MLQSKKMSAPQWYDTYVDEKNNCFATFRKKVTLIEMDIEGAEVIALTCLKDIIKEQRPVLAICAYHKKDDFVSIPELIKNTVDDYRFYIRKYYPNPNKMRFQKDETVLYAVPFERVIK